MQRPGCCVHNAPTSSLSSFPPHPLRERDLSFVQQERKRSIVNTCKDGFIDIISIVDINNYNNCDGSRCDVVRGCGREGGGEEYA